MYRTVIAMTIAIIAAAAGHLLLSKGMKEVGEVGISSVRDLGRLGLEVGRHPLIIAGVALQALFFALYLASLSWSDLTFVLPLTAADYVLIALFARFYLVETVTLERWAGTLLIVAGVVLVGRSY